MYDIIGKTVMLKTEKIRADFNILNGKKEKRRYTLTVPV
jgi:hypothetical protein